MFSRKSKAKQNITIGQITKLKILVLFPRTYHVFENTKLYAATSIEHVYCKQNTT